MQTADQMREDDEQRESAGDSPRNDHTIRRPAAHSRRWITLRGLESIVLPQT